MVKLLNSTDFLYGSECGAQGLTISASVSWYRPGRLQDYEVHGHVPARLWAFADAFATISIGVSAHWKGSRFVSETNNLAPAKIYHLLGADGVPYDSTTPGQIGTTAAKYSG